MADARHQRRLPLEVLERRRLELAARLEGEELARRPVAQQVHLGEVAAPEDAERAVLSVEVAGGQVERAGRGGDARRRTRAGAAGLRGCPLHETVRKILDDDGAAARWCMREGDT